MSDTKPEAIVAAGRQIDIRRNSGTDLTKVSREGKEWQARAWEFYDTVGEFRYAADWTGAMLSKALLVVKHRTADGGEEEVTSGPVYDLLGSLYGGFEQQGEMLRALGINFVVAGDCYLVGWTKKSVEKWRVSASTEFTARAGNVYVGGKQIDSDSDVFAMRIWRPHPRKYKEANAPSRAVLGILSEIEGLTKHVAAQIDSRLAGAGVLLLPQEMTFPTKQITNPDGSTTTVANTADAFIDNLIKTMMEAIGDRESASALVPLILQIPGDQIGKAELLKFWTDLDEHAIELRNEAIRRLALGLDVPPEVLTGVGDTNHWNAWAIDDAGIKAHAEPLLYLITSSLTEGYLRPLLDGDDTFSDDPADYWIEADTSGIRLRPNRSQEAFEMYDRDELSGDALRRETGFTPSDAPTPEESVQWFLRKVASGSTTPDLVEAALKALGVPLEGAATTEDDTQEERPTPSLSDHPTQNPPSEPEDQAAADERVLVMAAEQMVFRALERAGNRLKTRTNVRHQGVSAAELYLYFTVDHSAASDLLIDAWTQVPRFCPDLGVDSDRLTAALDSYCRVLITERKPHDRSLLANYLALTRAEV